MFSTTDIATFLACQHTATLKRAESRKEITEPFFDYPAVELLRKLWLEGAAEAMPQDGIPQYPVKLFHGVDGVEQLASTPELHSGASHRDRSIVPRQVSAISPGGQDATPSLYRIEATSGPGSGVKILNAAVVFGN